MEICLMHVNAVPQPLSARTAPPVTPELDALVLRCLAKAPADRPEDAAGLLLLLDACPVPGRWTSADAAHWWADREELSSAMSLSTAVRGGATVAAFQDRTSTEPRDDLCTNIR